MATPDHIHMERERLYESPSLRDDLNDEEAQVLLSWAEAQVERLAQHYSGEDFAQQARFLRQITKNINRFVGQREFNDHEGQAKYLKKVVMYFPKFAVFGWDEITQEDISQRLPADPADMARNLAVILRLLDPPATTHHSGGSHVSITAGTPDHHEPPLANDASRSINPTQAKPAHTPDETKQANDEGDLPSHGEEE